MLFVLVLKERRKQEPFCLHFVFHLKAYYKEETLASA